MRYGVVVCSQCRRPQAVELRYRAVGCRGCGQAMALAERKLLFQGDDERAVQQAVARLGAQRAGPTIEAMTEALSAADEPPRGGVPDLLAALATRQGTFTQAEFEQAVRELRLAQPPDRLLATLLRDSVVFEPRPGVFRFLG